MQGRNNVSIVGRFDDNFDDPLSNLAASINLVGSVYGAEFELTAEKLSAIRCGADDLLNDPAAGQMANQADATAIIGGDRINKSASTAELGLLEMFRRADRTQQWRPVKRMARTDIDSAVDRAAREAAERAVMRVIKNTAKKAAAKSAKKSAKRTSKKSAKKATKKAAKKTAKKAARKTAMKAAKKTAKKATRRGGDGGNDEIAESEPPKFSELDDYDLPCGVHAITGGDPSDDFTSDYDAAIDIDDSDSDNSDSDASTDETASEPDSSSSSDDSDIGDLSVDIADDDVDQSIDVNVDRDVDANISQDDIVGGNMDGIIELEDNIADDGGDLPPEPSHDPASAEVIGAADMPDDISGYFN